MRARHSQRRMVGANQMVQRTGANRLALIRIERQRRLAPVADPCVDQYRMHLDMKSALEITGALVLGLVWIALFLGWNRLFMKRASSILEKWAAANGLEILDCQRPFYSGAFNWWTTSGGQVVYSVRVRDKKGHERSGWVRCGNYWNGVLSSDKIEVKWNEP